MFGNANREMTDKRLQTNMIESLKAAFKTIIITVFDPRDNKRKTGSYKTFDINSPYLS